jgi:hypothetical protein
MSSQRRKRQARGDRRATSNPPRPTPYPGYRCIHSVFEVHSESDEQEFWEGTGAPATPYLLLESTPCEGADADRMEIVIPYDQLEDVIRVLIAARKLRPPRALWRKTAGRWAPIEEATS